MPLTTTADNEAGKIVTDLAIAINCPAFKLLILDLPVIAWFFFYQHDLAAMGG
jgi:hypothetical protein